MTFSQITIAAVERVCNLVQKDQRWMMHGACYLLYRLTDELVDEAVTVAENMQEALEFAEGQLFADAG